MNRDNQLFQVRFTLQKIFKLKVVSFFFCLQQRLRLLKGVRFWCTFVYTHGGVYCWSVSSKSNHSHILVVLRCVLYPYACPVQSAEFCAPISQLFHRIFSLMRSVDRRRIVARCQGHRQLHSQSKSKILVVVFNWHRMTHAFSTSLRSDCFAIQAHNAQYTH